MKYQNKYNDFKAEVIINLRQLLEKGYDRTEEWEDEHKKFDLPIQYYMEDFGYEAYSLVKYDMDGFKGISRESDDDYWFEIEELDLFTLCQIADYLEQD